MKGEPVEISRRSVRQWTGQRIYELHFLDLLALLSVIALVDTNKIYPHYPFRVIITQAYKFSPH